MTKCINSVQFVSFNCQLEGGKLPDVLLIDKVYKFCSIHKFQLSTSDYASQVSKERGEGIAREHNISFLETSAKVR